MRQLNSGIPGPLHDSNSASEGNKVMGHCVINRHQTTEFTKYSIYLQVVSDWITYDFQYYCENTVQSLGVKNLCGEKKMCIIVIVTIFSRTKFADYSYAYLFFCKCIRCFLLFILSANDIVLSPSFLFGQIRK